MTNTNNNTAATVTPATIKAIAKIAVRDVTPEQLGDLLASRDWSEMVTPAPEGVTYPWAVTSSRLEAVPVEELLDGVKAGTYRPASSQRIAGVWTAQQAMLLVDSLLRGWPCSVITLVYIPGDDKAGTTDLYLIIDGLQRLTALRKAEEALEIAAASGNATATAMLEALRAATIPCQIVTCGEDAAAAMFPRVNNGSPLAAIEGVAAEFAAPVRAALATWYTWSDTLPLRVGALKSRALAMCLACAATASYGAVSSGQGVASKYLMSAEIVPEMPQWVPALWDAIQGHDWAGSHGAEYWSKPARFVPLVAAYAMMTRPVAIAKDGGAQYMDYPSPADVPAMLAAYDTRGGDKYEYTTTTRKGTTTRKSEAMRDSLGVDGSGAALNWRRMWAIIALLSPAPSKGKGAQTPEEQAAAAKSKAALSAARKGGKGKGGVK